MHIQDENKLSNNRYKKGQVGKFYSHKIPNRAQYKRKPLKERIWNICQNDKINILHTFITNIEKLNIIAWKAFQIYDFSYYIII